MSNRSRPKVTMTTWGNGHGHLARCLALAEPARHLGWDVTIAVLDRHQAVRVANAGCRAWIYPSDSVPAELWTPFTDDAFVERSVDVDLALLRETRADLVIHDGRLSTPVAAALQHRPCVGVAQHVHLPGQRFEGRPEVETLWTESAAAFNHLLRRHGIASQMRDVRELFLRERIAIPSIPDMDPLLATVDERQVDYVGPLTGLSTLEGGDTAAHDNGQGVFFYRTANEVERCEEFREAFKDFPAELIIATGEEQVATELRARLPRGAFRIDALWDLRTAGTLIGAGVIHGGHGTSLTCLQAGLPTVVLAEGNPERRSNGLRLQAMGVGMCLGGHTHAGGDWSLRGSPEAKVPWSTVREHLDRLRADGALAERARARAILLARYSLLDAFAIIATGATVPDF
jgi:UDP:flavonoid glycosyltransferase YjiC (YdhE family)